MSIFKQFQTGQKVSIKELECGCQLTILAADQPGLDVIEIGRDYLVIEDVSAGIKTRIPRHLIFANTAAAPAVPAPLAQSA
jgi:hypothetical protein